MKFKFQVYSDLHQEFITNIFKLPQKSDYLILAGDINSCNKSNFKPFFKYVSENWKHVFYVPGNHEYYNRYCTLDKLKKEYKLLLEEFDNVHFLDDDCHFIEIEKIKIKIIGSTLWSHVTDTQSINDFKNIHIGDDIKSKEPSNTQTKELSNTVTKVQIKEQEYITKDVFNTLHQKSVEFITKEIDILDEKEKAIIITHFPPTQNGTSHNIHKTSPQYVKDYFASNILKTFDKHINKDKILCWVYGHTHYSSDMIDAYTGIRLISNQLGYLQEHSIMNMIPDGVFSIEL